MRKSLYLVAAVCLLPAMAAVAQTTILGLENFTLERPQPTPTVTPTPSPLPSPAPTTSASPRTPPATARPSPTPSASRAATPPPAAIPATPVATAPSEVAPTAMPDLVPTPLPTSPAPAATAADRDSGWLWWAALAATVLAGLAGLAWWRLRRTGDSAELETPQRQAAPARTTDFPAPPLAPAPPPAPPSVTPVVESAATALPPAAPASPRPRGLVTSSMKPDVRIGLVPLRGGVDTLRATLEYQIQLSNIGRGMARSVAVEAWLLSAGHGIADDLQQLFTGPTGQLMLTPFDLPPTAAIDLPGIATAPREVLTTINAGERRMFVPVVAVRVRFGETVLNAAFLVGIERPGQDRLAPLPLDRGTRMHDTLAARPYGA